MEYLDIVDENNQLTDKVTTKKQAHEEGEFHRTVHIWIMNDRLELLLQKRSANNKTNPNRYDISVAGHISSGESVIEGALRELKEELGVVTNESKLEYIATVKNTDNPHNKEFAYVFLLTCNQKLEEYTFQDEEVAEVKFVKFEELKQMIARKEENLLLRDHAYEKAINYIEQYKTGGYQLRFEKIVKENMELAIAIQNAIFPNEDGRVNYVECVNHDPYRRELSYFIVFDGNEPVGVTGLYAYHEYPEDAWLGWFGVLKDKRKRGYGNKILDHFENYAREKGYQNIRIYTDEVDNKEATKLYSSREMICERYTNEQETKEEIKHVLIFSKSLTDHPVLKWNNRFLGLTDQFEKESSSK